MRIESPHKNPEMDVSEALTKISAIEQQTMQMGGNEVEREQFKQIRVSVESREIDPHAGVLRAEKVKDSKSSENA